MRGRRFAVNGWGCMEARRTRLNLKHSIDTKKMAFLSLVLCIVLLPLSWGRPQVPCKFSIPATNATGSCDVYDLSSIAEIGARSFFVGNHSYVFSLCENVNLSAVPKPCKNASKAVAYQYFNNSKTCYSIGSLDSTYVVRVDLQTINERESLLYMLAKVYSQGVE